MAPESPCDRGNVDSNTNGQELNDVQVVDNENMQEKTGDNIVNDQKIVQN